MAGLDSNALRDTCFLGAIWCGYAACEQIILRNTALWLHFEKLHRKFISAPI